MNKTHRIILIVCSICVAVTGVIMTKQRAALAAAERQVEAASLDTPWRMTKDGWQDSRTWRDIQSESTSPEPGVHPIFWTLGVLLLAFGAMIWSSEEDDAEQIKKRARKTGPA